MFALGNAWYAPQWITSFHLFDDLGEWKQMDKVAHFFWTFQVSALAARLMLWAKLDDVSSAKVGAGLGFLFVSGIEIADGFSIAYGASLYDVVANALGAACFLGQRIVWKRILVWPKFSFHPSAFAPLRPEVLGSGFLEEMLKDYNGQTYWLSANLKSFMPKSNVPAWLNVAFGYGAEGLFGGTQNIAKDDNGNITFNRPDIKRYRQWFLAPDIDLSKIKTNKKGVKFILTVLSAFKFPAPSLEFSKGKFKVHAVHF